MSVMAALGNGYSIDDALKEVDWSDCYEGWTEELRYLMFRYDEYLSKKAGEKLNIGQWSKIWEVDPSKSIEHIMPQSSEEHYIHHLGNLTMLPPGVNSSLKDKSPAEKAATYKQCGLRGTMAVARVIEAGVMERRLRTGARRRDRSVRARGMGGLKHVGKARAKNRVRATRT
jgi:hypothetical protein